MEDGKGWPGTRRAFTQNIKITAGSGLVPYGNPFQRVHTHPDNFFCKRQIYDIKLCNFFFLIQK